MGAKNDAGTRADRGNEMINGVTIKNLEVKKDTLKLLFEKIYSPYQEITDGEIVLVHLKYIIRPQSQRNIIITENRNIK